MKTLRFLALLASVYLLFPLASFAQNARYDAPVSSAPGVTVQVCTHPANGVPCSNLATTYDSAGSACDTNTQDTPQPQPSKCQSGPDQRGFIGFWAPSGTYDYTYCVPSGSGQYCQGPFVITTGGAGSSGSVSSGTACQSLIYTSTGSTGSPSDAVCTISTATPGTTWADKVTTGMTAISNVGTIVIPGSVLNTSAYPSLTVPSRITLQFPNGVDFGGCNITLGTYSKIFNPGGARLLMDPAGSGCLGWNPAGTEPVLTANDTPILDGVRVNCQSQAGSDGIHISSGNNALFKIRNVSVTGCQDAGLFTAGVQFSEFTNVNLSGNYVGLKDYSTGGSSSNTFIKPNFTAETSGVGAIFWNTSTSQTMNGNHIIDPICNTDTIVCIAIIGVTGNGYTWNRFYIDGGTPEQNGTGPASVTIDGNTINNCGFISLNQAGAVLTNLEIHEASAQVNGCLTNNSSITFVGTSGGGVVFQADSTSFVNFVGPLNNDATIQNVNTWPTSVGGANFMKMYGSPVSFMNANTPQNFTGNPLFLPIATSNATSIGSAIDPVYSKVRTVQYAASVGNKGTNRVIFDTTTTLGAASDEIISVYANSGTDTIIACGDNNSNNAFTTTNLLANQWTRIVMYARNVTSGFLIQPDCYAADATGPLVEFYGLEVVYGPTGTAATQASIDQVLSGGINPNGYSSRFIPTIASGFGITPTVPGGKSTTAFTVNVGTGGSATSGVLTMPAATAGWTCQVNDLTAAAAHVAYNTRQTASTTTTVTVENQTTSTGAAVAWAASDILNLSCDPF